MLEFFYVISMSAAYMTYLGGTKVPFYLKYFIAIIWIIVTVIRKKQFGRLEYNMLLKFLIPYVLILVWTFFIWSINPQIEIRKDHVSRCISNTAYLFITYIAAFCAYENFKYKAIKLSLISMFCGTILNVISMISLYGIDMFLIYLPQAAFSTDFAYGTRMYWFSLGLEVGDITMTSGLMIIYIIAENKIQKNEQKTFNVLIMMMALVCGYIGFKRTCFFGVIFVFLIYGITKLFHLDRVKKIYAIGFSYIIFSLLYVFFVCGGGLEKIAEITGINFMGRISIYKLLSEYVRFSPLFLGNGFTYVDKTMHETTGFASHSIVIRMFAEIGFIPFLLWTWQFLIHIPTIICKKVDKTKGMLCFLVTLYVYFTYFMENTLLLFCLHFVWSLIIFCSLSDEKINNNKKHRFKIIL